MNDFIMWANLVMSLALLGYVASDAYRTSQIRRRHKDIEGLLSNLNQSCIKIVENAEKISSLSEEISSDMASKEYVKQIKEISQEQIRILNDFLRINNDLINAIYLDLGYIKRKLSGH